MKFSSFLTVRGKLIIITVFGIISLGYLISQLEIFAGQHLQNLKSNNSFEYLATKEKYSLIADRQLNQLSLTDIPQQHTFPITNNKWIDIVLIFKHGGEKVLMQEQFERVLSSMLMQTMAALNLHIVTDELGFAVADRLLQQVKAKEELQSKNVQVSSPLDI